MTASSSSTSDQWVYDPHLQVYYQQSSDTYAVPHLQTGQWSYTAAKDFHTSAESSAVAEKEREDGEVEDDVGWGGLMDPEKLASVVRRSEVPVAEKIHPAYRNDIDAPVIPPHLLRMVVVKSGALKGGGIAIIDAREGGIQIGRDRCDRGGQARIRVKEMEVSKTHAVIYWGKKGDEADQEEGWWVVDLGSTQGTYLSQPAESSQIPSSKPERLAEPKHSSRPYPLRHLSTLAIGGTTFSIHLHPSWPCDTCKLHGDNEIALDDGEMKSVKTEGPPATEYRWAMDSQEKRENREVKRKREMASLRETLLNSTPASQIEPDSTRRPYLDRSALRRRLHPPSPPSQRSTIAPTPITEPVVPMPSRFAQNILASQGWTPGTGLGKGGEGRVEPIHTEMRNGKKGLGAMESKAAEVGQEDWRIRGRMRRYEELGRDG
ncbi:hypothetical protein P7C73_g4341, partial [Tremellales sp. Uapishka_1]